jgi:hypothetical protein
MHMLDWDGQFDELIQEPAHVDYSLLLWYDYDIIAIVLELLSKTDNQVSRCLDGLIHVFQTSVALDNNLTLQFEVQLRLFGLSVDVHTHIQIALLDIDIFQQRKESVIEMILDNTLANRQSFELNIVRIELPHRGKNELIGGKGT